jgi:hypothetical protein
MQNDEVKTLSLRNSTLSIRYSLLIILFINRIKNIAVADIPVNIN